MERRGGFGEGDACEIERLIAEMGVLAESVVADALDALVEADLAKARSAIEAEERLRALREEVGRAAVRALERFGSAPVVPAKIVSAMRIVADLGRIGEIAGSVAKRTIVTMAQRRGRASFGALTPMRCAARDLIAHALAACGGPEYFCRDEELEALEGSMLGELLAGVTARAS